MLRIVSANLNGIRSAHDKGFFTWLDETSPDIVCVQELKAQEGDLREAMRQPPGYHAHFHYAEKKGYSGVGIYIGDGATANRIEGNWIGLDSTGAAAMANPYGILVQSAGNTIGGAGSGQMVGGVPGAASNQPVAGASAPVNGTAQTMQPMGGAAGAVTSSGRRDAVTNFEVDKTVRVVRAATGTVKRLAVAEVVLPQVGDVTRTRMNCLGRIVAL